MRHLITALFLLLCAASAQAGVFVGFGQSPPEASAEFDVSGAMYYAVAPSGHEYTEEQTANYSTRKYTTLSAAEAAIPASPETPTVINIIGTWSSADTTSVDFSGSTFTESNYCLVRTVGDARHGGVYSSGKYMLSNSTESQLSVSVSYVWIDGLQIYNPYTGTSQRKPVRFKNSAAGYSKISNTIVVGDYSSTAPSYGIGFESSTPIIYCWNNIVSGIDQASSYGIYSQGSSASGYIYNNTIVDCSNGVRVNSSTIVTKNNIAICATDGFVGTLGTGSTKNASPITGDGDVTLSSSTLTDYFESATDLHIKTAGTYSGELIGQGADLDQDAGLAVTDDIDGDTRDATAPDIGADED